MKTWKKIVIIAALVLVGSIVNFYVTNLLMSDISNLFYGPIDAGIISSLPAFFVECDLILGIFYWIRRLKNEGIIKRHTRTYSIILFAFSILGIITSILSGVIVYKSFTKPYPFGGYVIVMLVLHILTLVISVLGYLRSRKLPEDTNKTTIDGRYILHNVLMVLYAYFTFYRAGAFFWGFTYIQWSTLWITWPFYVWLFLPLVVLIFFLLYKFGYLKEHDKAVSITSISLVGVCVVFGLLTCMLSLTHTEFTSAISPAMPISRLSSMPIEWVLMFIVPLILSINIMVGHFSKKNRYVKK